MKSRLLLALFAFAATAAAQQPNWQNKDLKTDTVFGISTERAYKELLRDKKPGAVLVAVIDAYNALKYAEKYRAK